MITCFDTWIINISKVNVNDFAETIVSLPWKGIAEVVKLGIEGVYDGPQYIIYDSLKNVFQSKAPDTIEPNAKMLLFMCLKKIIEDGLKC